MDCGARGGAPLRVTGDVRVRPSLSFEKNPRDKGEQGGGERSGVCLSHRVTANERVCILLLQRDVGG